MEEEIRYKKSLLQRQGEERFFLLAERGAQIIATIEYGPASELIVDLTSGAEQLDIKVVTPSWETKQKCEEAGLTVIPLSEATEVDVAFDGCDQVDEHLHALKSGGGIHTDEKLVARMA